MFWAKARGRVYSLLDLYFGVHAMGGQSDLGGEYFVRRKGLIVLWRSKLAIREEFQKNRKAPFLGPVGPKPLY